MGREATCLCKIGDLSTQATALLESGELILRGQLRRRIPTAQIEDLRIEAGSLLFTHAGTRIGLTLGKELARKWRDAIRKPPPTLAAKLGIQPKTRIRTLGPVDDPNLEAAIAIAYQAADRPDLILARVDSLEDLDHARRQALPPTAPPIPLWVIYRKGPGKELNEATIRTHLREAGLMDTKVASVSPTLTALRFRANELTP